ncbi:hypothetical protein V8F06_001613 [Rhypophila decipiens]
MVTLRTLALLAAATLVASQTIESLDPCGQTCYNDVKAKAGTFGCAADDMSCLCAVADFKNGVHDCAKGACPAAGYGDTVLAAVNALCATAAPAAPTPEPTTAAPAPPEATSTPTPEAPITSAVPTSSISEAAATASTTPTASSTTTSTTPVVAGGAPTSTSTEEAAAKTAEPTTTSTTSSETTSTPESSQSKEPAGLPVAAKAGIGIGAGAAAVAILGLVAWILARQRRSKRANGFSSKHMIKISDPAPGGGRAFAGDNHYETGLSELEMKSRRYEDMVPRQQPRHMV